MGRLCARSVAADCIRDSLQERLGLDCFFREIQEHVQDPVRVQATAAPYYEARREWKLARKFYGKAIKTDREY